MRKRVGLARAIVGRPEILLYDEPVTGLDPVNAAAVDQLIMRDRARRRSVTSIVVTHDIEGALGSPTASRCSRAASCASSGTPEEFRAATTRWCAPSPTARAAAAAALKIMEEK